MALQPPSNRHFEPDPTEQAIRAAAFQVAALIRQIAIGQHQAGKALDDIADQIAAAAAAPLKDSR